MWGFVALLAGVASSVGQPKIIEWSVDTGVEAQPQINFLLRLPDGHSPEKPTAKGVVAYCTYERKTDALRSQLSGSGEGLAGYAMRQGFAVLTWNTATLWSRGKSHDQMERRQWEGEDKNFDQVARAWDRGVTQMCEKHNLPQTGFLLYGFSRGAHWSNRLALRLPKRFLAVHIHVANSYDRPTLNGGSVMWLITTGDMDRGRINAAISYQELRQRGYPVILKMFNGLGHNECREELKLRQEFFDYALRKQREAETRKTTPGEAMNRDLRESGLFGDFMSQNVFPLEKVSKIPEAQRVPLPDEAFAKAWGYFKSP